MSKQKLVVYLLRRDLRVSDNPVLHHLATAADHGFTHLLPVYVFPAHQVEISGFVKDGEESPYPPAKSQLGKFWRCGPLRAKFLAESVWDTKTNLEKLGSGLILRFGSAKEILSNLLDGFKENGPEVSEVWMTEEPSWEEIREQQDIADTCASYGVTLKLWKDEKYFIDDRDTGLSQPKDLPDVFTTYRKSQEPLRERPRKSKPCIAASALPRLPSHDSIPPQQHPFVSPETLNDLQARLHEPLKSVLGELPKVTDEAASQPEFMGGETAAWQRLVHLSTSGLLTSYKDTRNGLLGTEYSTRLSAYLSMGCLTARQIHEELVKLEDGTDETYKDANGYGDGENEGTKGIRFELLWRDYMRLCTRKFGRKLFRANGFREGEGYNKTWKMPDADAAVAGQEPSPKEIAEMFERFKGGTTGMGLIDASQRELLHTGYTSNRARQNVASFLSKHIGIDWRYGAEWYEMLLVDYDVSSNWANWQYVAGVGNDPRGDARTFNPVKQAFDYDKDGAYVKAWVSEVRELPKLENVFQAWTSDPEDLESCGIADDIMVKDPLKRIEFHVDKKPKASRRTYSRKRAQPRGGRWQGNGALRSGMPEVPGGFAGPGYPDLTMLPPAPAPLVPIAHSTGPWRGNVMDQTVPFVPEYAVGGWYLADGTQGHSYNACRGGPRGYSGRGFRGRQQPYHYPPYPGH